MTKDKPLISIIIPVYNGEKYIPNCLKNLKDLTYDKWEAVFINDGSSDNTLPILKSCAQEDKRIKIISQKNSGVAIARCKGLENISGEYFTFLDVDDSLENNALNLLVNDAFQTNGDIIHSGFNFIKEDKIINRQIIKPEHLSQIEYCKKILTGKLGWQLCGRLYKSNLLTETIICPTGLKCGEDCALLIQFINRAKTISTIQDNVYNYHYYPNSASNIQAKDRGLQMIQARDFVKRYLNDSNLILKLKQEISMFELLCLSSAIRKGLNKKDPQVKDSIRRIRIKTLCKLPIKKIANIALFILR